MCHFDNSYNEYHSLWDNRMIAEALMCMALNIYHEARNQSMVGQVAVGEVVMNRVEDSRFPDTICEVVKQAVTYKNTDKPVLHKCQFSWYCDGQKDEPDFDSFAWRCLVRL